MTPLNTNDYKQILEYYKKPIPGSTRQMKIDAEKNIGMVNTIP